MSVPPFGSTTWTPWPCPFTCRPRAWPLSGGAGSAWRPWGFYRVLTNTLRRRAEGTHDPEVRLQRPMPHLGSLNRSWNDQPLPITSSHCKLGGALRNSKKASEWGTQEKWFLEVRRLAVPLFHGQKSLLPLVLIVILITTIINLLLHGRHLMYDIIFLNPQDIPMGRGSYLCFTDKNIEAWGAQVTP